MYVDLDAKDRELLDILKRDARTPVTVLAEVLSLSRNTVQKRIDRLVNSGVIDGFTIRVNEQLQPDKIKALMSVELEGLSTTQLISKLRQVNGVERFHTTNGNWDLLIVITAAFVPGFSVPGHKRHQPESGYSAIHDSVHDCSN